MTHTDGAPAAQPSFQEVSTGDARTRHLGVHALDLRASALTALRDFDNRAAKFLNRLVARVRLELTTSAL